jgi:acyl-CoA synthetase (AMP-forming)/AMP-acid ligase II
MSHWNFADIWESIADRFPADAAQVYVGRSSQTWSEFDRRADGIAQALLRAGLGHQDKVAHYLYNGPEYLESMFAMFKAGLVPVNTNYRYTDDELMYLWDNADVRAVVFHGAFSERCAALRDRMKDVVAWFWVDDGTHGCPSWAIPYEQAAAERGDRVVAPWGRSGDDLYLLYTGGTTGYPKGVMWPQHDLFSMLEATSGRDPERLHDADAYVAEITRSGPRVLPAAPLMHGTAAWVAMAALSRAGSIVTLPSRKFDVEELLDAVSQESVNGLCIVGDAFARPLLDLLDGDPDRWDLSRFRVLFTGGAMLSADVKRRLLEHVPRLIISDNLGSSEAGSLARSMTTDETKSSAETARFTLFPGARVVDESGREVKPGSGVAGRLATAGYIPVGYYKDPVKSAATFVTIDGTRYVIPGDWAEVDADGHITLLGRGSECINTGGEKVYPEEVEEALKTFPGVRDAIVVGVPDERFGERIVAVVSTDDADRFDEAELLRHAQQSLARYKLPRATLVVDDIGRSPSGKADYPATRRLALERLSGAAS